MCDFRKYLEVASSGSSDRRGIVINTLTGYQRERGLSRLESAKAAMSNLKVQLSTNQSLDLKAELRRAIAELQAAPKATV